MWEPLFCLPHLIIAQTEPAEALVGGVRRPRMIRRGIPITPEADRGRLPAAPSSCSAGYSARDDIFSPLASEYL